MDDEGEADGPWSRRTIVGVVGTGLTAGLAGCTGGGSSTSVPTEEDQGTGPEGTPTDGEIETVTDNDTETRTPEEQNSPDLSADDYRELNDALEPKPVGTNVRDRKTMKEDLVTIHGGIPDLIGSEIYHSGSLGRPLEDEEGEYGHITPELLLERENIMSIRKETASTGSTTTMVMETRPLVSSQGEVRADTETALNPDNYETDQELAEAAAHQVNDEMVSERSDLEKVEQIDDHWTRYQKTDQPVVVEAIGNEIVEHINVDAMGQERTKYKMEEGIELMRQTYQGEKESAMERGGAQEALYREAQRLMNGESKYIEGNFSKVGVEWHGDAHEDYDGAVGPLQDRRTVGIKKNGELERVH